MLARFFVGAACSVFWVLTGSSLVSAQLSIVDFTDHLSQISPVSGVACNAEGDEVDSKFGFDPSGDSCCAEGDILVYQYSGTYYCSDPAIRSVLSGDPGNVFAKKFEEVPGVFLPGRPMVLGPVIVGGAALNWRPGDAIQRRSYVGLTYSSIPLEDTGEIRVDTLAKHVKVPPYAILHSRLPSPILDEEYGNYNYGGSPHPSNAGSHFYNVYESSDTLSEHAVPAEGVCPDGYVSLNSLRYSGDSTYFSRFPLLKFSLDVPGAGLSPEYHLPYNVCRLEMKPIASRCRDLAKRAARRLDPGRILEATDISDAYFNGSLMKFITRDFSDDGDGSYTFASSSPGYCAVYPYGGAEYILSGKEDIGGSRGTDRFLYWNSSTQRFVDNRGSDSGFPPDFPSPYMCGAVSGAHTNITYYDGDDGNDLISVVKKNGGGGTVSKNSYVFDYFDEFSRSPYGQGISYINDGISLFAHGGYIPSLRDPVIGCGSGSGGWSRMEDLHVFKSPNYNFSPLKTSFATESEDDIVDPLYYYHSCSSIAGFLDHSNPANLPHFYSHRCNHSWDRGYCEQR